MLIYTFPRSTLLDKLMALSLKVSDMNQEQQKSRLKELIARGKEQGYLTYSEVNDHLPADITDPEQIEDIISMINDMGIRVSEDAPEMDELLLTETEVVAEDEGAAEEVAQAIPVVG